jgi:hypothetical protein
MNKQVTLTEAEAKLVMQALYVATQTYIAAQQMQP